MEPAPDNEVPARTPEAPDATSRVLLHMPVDVRNASLAVLSALAVVATLRWASGFFIPFMLGLAFTYALSPIVDWLARLRVPRSASAAVLILGILGAAGGSLYSMADDANDFVNSLPGAARKFTDAVRQRSHGKGQQASLETVQQATAELQRAAQAAGAAAPANAGGKGLARVVVERPAFDIRDYVLSGTLGALELLGQVVLVTFLTYFLLVSGDTFRRKLVKIAGPSMAKKKLAVQALDEINDQIQRYLLVQVLASIGVGIATGVAFALIGLNHAAVWGVVAGVLTLIPYVGAVLVTLGAALAGFMQTGEPNMALAVSGASLLIHIIEGHLLVPWATSKASRMNPVAVFVGVLAWGWLWGVWGLLLGVPVLMAVKAVCDRVDHLRAIGELLGD